MIPTTYYRRLDGLPSDPDAGTFIGLQVSTAAIGALVWVVGAETSGTLFGAVILVLYLLESWRAVRSDRYLKKRERDSWVKRSRP